jgi:hypothetical protein
MHPLESRHDWGIAGSFMALEEEPFYDIYHLAVTSIAVGIRLTFP